MYVDILQNFNKDKNMLSTNDVQSINNSINNLLFIKRGERVGLPNLGIGLDTFLFEEISPFLASVIEDIIFDVVRFYETRIDELKITCTPDADNNRYNIRIEYTIAPENISGEYITTLKRI